MAPALHSDAVSEGVFTSGTLKQVGYGDGGRWGMVMAAGVDAVFGRLTRHNAPGGGWGAVLPAFLMGDVGSCETLGKRHSAGGLRMYQGTLHS